MSELVLETDGETNVIVTRWFESPVETVFRAHVEPALIQQWMLGPDGWSMPVCLMEARPGGKIRYEWSDGGEGGFFLTGEVLEVEAPHRIVHVERMHLGEVTPDNHIETTFQKAGSGTLMTMTMRLPNAESRAAMLATGMDTGMEASYKRLEQLEGATTSSADSTTSVHFSIDVPDLDAGVAFYGRVFGFVETSRPFESMAILDAHTATVCMHQKPAGTKPAKGSDATRDYKRHWTPVHLDVQVQDFEGVLEKVTHEQGTIETTYREGGPRPVAFCADPFGNGFCVVGPRFEIKA